MKKAAKNDKGFWEGGLNVVIDERLNKLKGKVWATKKLEEANKRLSRIKSLPK